MKKTIKKLPKSEISIAVELPEEAMAAYRAQAVKNIGEHVEVSGFRKGKAPANLVEKEIRPAAILEEMASLAVADTLPKILVEEKIDAIGRPMITITKLAPGNPLEYTAVVAVFPEVKLPDYAKLAAKIEKSSTDTAVSDEELDKAIIELKKARKHQAMHDDKVEHDHDTVAKETDSEEMDAALTDEYVRELGPFDSVDAFKEQFKKNIQTEKDAREHEKRRIAILEAVQDATEVEIPNLLVDNQLEQLIARMRADISQMGLSFDDYLTHMKKTESDLRTELAPDAEKRAKSELVLHSITTAEKLTPKQEDIDRETARLMETYKDADPERARAYVTQLLANEEVFKFLEGQE